MISGNATIRQGMQVIRANANWRTQHLPTSAYGVPIYDGRRQASAADIGRQSTPLRLVRPNRALEASSARPPTAAQHAVARRFFRPCRRNRSLRRPEGRFCCRQHLTAARSSRPLRDQSPAAACRVEKTPNSDGCGRATIRALIALTTPKRVASTCRGKATCRRQSQPHRPIFAQCGPQPTPQQRPISAGRVRAGAGGRRHSVNAKEGDRPGGRSGLATERFDSPNQ